MKKSDLEIVRWLEEMAFDQVMDWNEEYKRRFPDRKIKRNTMAIPGKSLFALLFLWGFQEGRNNDPSSEDQRVAIETYLATETTPPPQGSGLHAHWLGG